MDALHPGVPRRRRGRSTSSTAPSFARYSQAGVVTPDHTIRTKNWPLIVPAPEAGKLDGVQGRTSRAAVANFIGKYRTYFESQQRARAAAPSKPLDPLPRVVLVPGLGLFGLGRQRQGRAHRRRPRRGRDRDDHRRGGDRTLRVDLAKPTCSTWSIGRPSRPSSARRPASRSPARSWRSPARAAAIGAATARAFAAAGAEVALLDVKLDAAIEQAKADRRRRGSSATSPTPARCSAAFDQVVGDLRRRSTSWCRMPARRRRRARSATSTRR